MGRACLILKQVIQDQGHRVFIRRELIELSVLTPVNIPVVQSKFAALKTRDIFGEFQFLLGRLKTGLQKLKGDMESWVSIPLR